MQRNGSGWGGLLAAAITLTAEAASPQREPLAFSRTWDVGLGRSVYVVGSHADLGEWDPARAVRLGWTPGNLWTGTVAIQSGTLLEYKFIARDNHPTNACEPANVEWSAGSNLVVQIPPAALAPYAGKTVYYHSGWTNAALIYRHGTNWFDAAMQAVGPGRTTNEFRYRLSGIGAAGEPLEFIPHGWLGGNEFFDHAPYGGYGNSNYFTSLDVCFVQDGHVFNYTPPPAVSASRIVVTNVASSWAPAIPGRDIRIYLPRGYDDNPGKRYPVLYLHDGQNVFFPGGAFGSWLADRTADREISQGRLRECILVGIDNTANRLAEYCPPGDSVLGNAGIADAYANFIIHNVRPTVDTHFRTLTAPRDTLVMGSSMGGLVSAYMGWETNGFGAIGVMSPSFWTASNFVARIAAGAKRDLRIYMDFGTQESASPEAWHATWQVYAHWLADNYAPNADLHMVTGCGQAHNEAAWAARLPAALHYLLGARDEPNPLALAEHPPQLAALSVTGGVVEVSFPALLKHTYRLERAPTLHPAAWTPVALTTGILPWSAASLADAPSATNAAFYRIVGE